MTNRLLKKARDLLRSQRGNVAMMFGLALVPMMIAVGAGLDYARTSLVRSQMADALDAAALAVGSSPGLNHDTAQDLAKKYFAANYTGSGAPTVSIDDSGYNASGSVTVKATYDLPTELLKFANITTLPVSVSSTVVWGQSKLWVSLVLDNSGSMCQPLSQPCVDTTDTRAKIYQLKAATATLLSKLQSASTNAGDVKVGLVPFTRVVNYGKDGSGSSNTGASWIDWSFWEAPPANITLSTSVGPGSNCPFSDNNQGYHCLSDSPNNSSSASKIPSSGMICPSIDNGRSNADRNDRYYNGCWDSVIVQTQTVTSTNTTPITTKQDCSQKGTGTITCNNKSGYPQNGNTSNATATVITAGYTGDSTSTSSNTPAVTPVDGTKSCNNGSPKTCTWTRTISQTKTDTTVTATGYGGYTHTWRPNAHSTWSGCFTERAETRATPNSTTIGYDTRNLAPGSDTTGFPADNPQQCLGAPATPLSNISTTADYNSLNGKVDDMQAAGSTNQAIGVAHGWQMLTQGDPYGTAAVPSNTARYIILLSDGLNTQDRWWGDGSTEGTSDDNKIDDRMNLVCTAAKNDGVIIYTLYVHVNGGGNSTPLKNCATDTTKYYDLTSADQITAAFSQIAQQITNVRVSR